MPNRTVITILIVVMVALLLTLSGLGLYFWRSGSITPPQTNGISPIVNTTTTIPVVSATLVGAQGKDIIDVINNSQVKGYIEPKMDIRELDYGAK